MLKPPASSLPGVTDTLDFVKNLWGSMSIPGATGTGMPGMPGMPSLGGMASPAMSTEELDKRITDLKAVETWLNMNLTMLRGTIQALEVQRGTLAALKSMGDSMADAMRQSGADKMPANPFAAFFTPPVQPTDARSARPAGAPSAASGARPASGGDTAQPGAAPNAGTETGAAVQAAMGWWNLMQDQFRQAVATAMTPAAPAANAHADAAPPAPAAAQPDAAPAPAPDAGGNDGIGTRIRTPRPKADKA